MVGKMVLSMVELTASQLVDKLVDELVYIMAKLLLRMMVDSSAVETENKTVDDTVVW